MVRCFSLFVVKMALPMIPQIPTKKNRSAFSILRSDSDGLAEKMCQKSRVMQKNSQNSDVLVELEKSIIACTVRGALVKFELGGP